MPVGIAPDHWVSGKMKAVVTGGAGFIGSHVAEELFAMGHQVLVLDDLSGGFASNVPPGVEFERAGINSPLDELFHSYKPDLVYHLAAYAAEGLSHHIPLFNYENNLQGTVNLLSASYRSGVRHFIFTFFIGGLRTCSRGAVRSAKRHPCAPCDPYGIAKLACENHIRSV